MSRNFSSMYTLEGKVIVLTGGAGLYGRGLTSHLASCGAVLILASRNLGALEKVAAEESAQGRQVHARQYDQGDPDSIAMLCKSVLDDFGPAYGLVNNSVARPMKSASAPISDWEDSMKINATGLFAITRAFAETMAQHGGGAIVNIGSIQGVVGPDYSLYEGLDMHAIPDYFFHKAGMIGLTRFFAARYGPQRVRVNCVSPGGFLSGQHPTFVERYCKATFLRRMANDQDLGGPVAFLLSEASAYVTGVNLPIDGGYTAR